MRLLAGPARKFLVGKILDRIAGKKPISLPCTDVDPRIMLERARMHVWATGVSGHELQRWMHEHPTSDTTMWAVGMDVGIRLHNLCLACSLCNADRTPYHQAIIVHARWLNEHLETAGGMATSHLLGGLLGMIAAAVCVQDAWIQERGVEAARTMANEVSKQILPDGMSFEASTAYHRHVADILVWTSLLMSQHDTMKLLLTENWWERVDKVTYALHFLEEAGMPLIGDNDDGMAVKVNATYPGTASTELLWSAYVDRLGRPKPLPPIKPSHIPFTSFGMDLWFYERYTLTMRCGQVGQYGKGGHAHNDANSLTLLVGDEPFFIDAGSFVYTADEQRRNSDRSTYSHNTVVSEREQCAWPEGNDGLFWMFPVRVAPTILERGLGTWRGTVVHDGKRGWEHQRTVVMDATSISITDDVGPLMVDARMTLLVAPNITIELHEDYILLRGTNRSIEISGITSNVTIEEATCAPAYQVEQSTKRIVVPVVGSRLRWTITLR